MKSVSILGMGHTLSSYLQDFESNNYSKPTDEVWGINSVPVWLRGCDLLIAMDNFRRDIGMEDGKHRQYVKNILTAGVPIMTDVVDYKLCDELNVSEFVQIDAYPLRKVIADIWPKAKRDEDCFPWFQNTVNYAIALAIARDYREIRLYGCNFLANDNPYTLAAVAQEDEDAGLPFWFPYHRGPINKGRKMGEPGLETTCWLLGIAHARGIAVRIPPGDSLMNADRAMYWYGYQTEPEPFGDDNDFEIP